MESAQSEIRAKNRHMMLSELQLSQLAHNLLKQCWRSVKGRLVWKNHGRRLYSLSLLQRRMFINTRRKTNTTTGHSVLTRWFSGNGATTKMLPRTGLWPHVVSVISRTALTNSCYRKHKGKKEGFTVSEGIGIRGKDSGNDQSGSKWFLLQPPRNRSVPGMLEDQECAGKDPDQRPIRLKMISPADETN